ncbi:MAG TPA: DUF1071 domain-containing protein [Rhodocyclaceae bacterium]|nr:DUF1071 domain-containing protein [Rhodocyclaceae bacterium]
MSDSINSFRRLFEIDVFKYVEKKGQFHYLSWAFAVAQLRLADPLATWEVKRFDGLPYLVTDLGVFVEVAVTVSGITLMPDTSGARCEESTHRRADELRHQHKYPALPG